MLKSIESASTFATKLQHERGQLALTIIKIQKQPFSGYLGTDKL